MGLLPDILTPILNYVGVRETNASNVRMATEANQMSQGNAREQMEFQREMSNTAYQRAMADMKAAGLNPMLAYQQGGATSPSGASGSVTSATMENEIGAAVGSATEMRRLRKELESAESGIKLNEATEQYQKAQRKLSESNAKATDLQNKALSLQMPAIQQKAKIDYKRGLMDERFLEYDAIGDRVKAATGIISNAAGVARDWGLRKGLNQKEVPNKGPEGLILVPKQ